MTNNLTGCIDADIAKVIKAKDMKARPTKRAVSHKKNYMYFGRKIQHDH